MKISMICFSLTGQQTGEKLLMGLRQGGAQVCLFKKSKYLPDSIPESAGEWAGKQFAQADGIIFIGACGIAVRSIAPHIRGKKTDPAVLVVDECGHFVISLLSGHLGGANALAHCAAELLGATPVVTTATDLHTRFAVDEFARKNGCAIFRMREAKEVSAALLAGEKVGFYSEFPWEGVLPEGLAACERDGKMIENTCGQLKENTPPVGIAFTVHRDRLPFPSTVHVVPPAVFLGMGCRKGKDEESILHMASECLERNSLYREALGCLASIDLKKEEAGLIGLSRRWKLPFVTFSGQELMSISGDFTPSAFVKSTVGVENVCERSAVLAASQRNPGNVRLIQKKMASDGVTAALAIGDWRIHFE